MPIGVARLNTISALVSAGALSYSFVGITTANATTTVTVPTLVAGDIIIIFDRTRNGNTVIPTAVTPSGYTNIYNFGAASATIGYRVMIHWKTAVSGDSGATVTGVNAAASNKIALVYRFNQALTTATYTSTGAQATDNAPTNQSLNLASVTGPYVAISHYGGTGSPTHTPTAGMTRFYSPTTAARTNIWESTSSSVSFSNQTITLTDGGSQVLTSGYITFS
jgi:hypothetical protein